MNLEGFSKRGMELGDDPEGIKETKNDLHQQYLDAIKMLASEKKKNDFLFEGLLNSAIRRLSSLGLNVSRDSILKDVEFELFTRDINKGIDINNEPTSLENINYQEVDDVLSATKGEVEQLKANINGIFDSPKVQQTSNQSVSTPIEHKQEQQDFDEIYDSLIKKLTELRKSNNSNYGVELENAIRKISSLTDRIPDVRSQIESDINHEMGNMQQHEEIHNQMNQAQSDLAQTLEWAKHQPNIQKTVALGGNRNDELPEWTKDRGVSGYTEPSLEQMKEEFISQKGQSQTTQQPIPNSSSETNMSNNSEKESLINSVISEMLNRGEFSRSGLDISAKMADINYVKEKLKTKSVDELRLLLSSYQRVDDEQKDSSGMHR